MTVSQPIVWAFHEKRSFTMQYIVADPVTKHCAVIDPVLDYDEKSGSTATDSADALLAHIRQHDLKPVWLLDTHPHADHFSALAYLKQQTGAPTGIGEHVRGVQVLWKDIYNLPGSFPTDGSQWDHLFRDGETFSIGALQGSVLFSPGHTLASISYVIGNAAFIHDTIFMPDCGTARADFPGADPHQLWHSIQRILALPAETRLFTGHDYPPVGREPRWESSIAEQKAQNPHVQARDEAAFVALRTARDRTLPMPKLILHALQVNINGGMLPAAESNGRRYLKIPIDAMGVMPW